MRSDYEEFLQRLIRYRLCLNLTQEEAGNVLGITQSQFSKIELGKTIMPYKGLKRLMGVGWDIDYLVTGKESVKSESGLKELISQAGNENKEEFLCAATWLLEQGIIKSVPDINFETRCEIEVLKRKTSGENSGSVLYEIRKISGIAQIPMSEKLGVNIKKYRMLEKNKANPDAELLLRIYKETGCKPSLLIDFSRVENVIIDDLWQQIKCPLQERILALSEQVLYYLKM